MTNRVQPVPRRHTVSSRPSRTPDEKKETVKLIRIGLHSLMLTLADLAGILSGFFAYKTFNCEQITIQLPVAMAVSILLFLLWTLLLPVLGGRQFRLADLKEMLLVFACSLLWAPAVFVPLHFLAQGYVTAAENLIMLALYQLPINLIALCAARIIQD